MEDGGGAQADLLAHYWLGNHSIENRTLATIDFNDYYRWDPTWNFAVLNPTGAGGTGPIGFFGPTMQWNAGGDQHCNALLLSVQRALNLIASGWKWSGIYRFTSGMPLMIQDGTDAALSAINHQQPNLVLPNSVYTGQSGPGQFYFNKAAFAAQSAGTFTGNLGWNSLRGPTDWDMDMALSREFRISKIQFALKYTF